jgi:hypothetical protein
MKRKSLIETVPPETPDLLGLAIQSHNHQCWRRKRFDYHSGLLTTWCGPENSERCRGWIEKGIPGCR